MSVSRDITDEYEAKALALRQRQLLQMALDEGELGSWTHDLATGELSCSSTFRDHFGLPAEGPVSIDTLLTHVDPDCRDEFAAKRALALTQNGGHRLEVRTLDRMGMGRVLMTHFQVECQEGRAPLVSGVSVDITSRRMIEASAGQAQSLVGKLVYERTRMLADLNAHTIATIEHERKALARDLHDEMGAILTLMSFEVSRLKDRLDHEPDLQQSVGQLDTLLQSLRDYKHRVIAGLRPPLLQELGLELALASYAEEFARSAQTEVKAHIDSPLPPLKEAASLALFRLLQEGLTNVAKYAQATCVSIDVVADETQVTMELTDNGVGLPVDGVSTTRFGLIGIRERIQALGGTACFERITRDGGTRISVSLPLAGNLEPDEQPSERVAT